jgi:hypothetical protein
MTNSADVVAVLQLAKEKLQRRGWTRCPNVLAAERGVGPICIGLALPGDVTLATMYAAALRCAINNDSFVTWNDTICESLEQALAAYDRAIQLVEAGR